MKSLNIHKKALIPSTNTYLKFVIVIIPLLNFLTGINIDLISPSLPAIAHYFQVNMHVVEETIAVTMIGFSFGCMFFGTMIDSFGRRILVLFGLLCYFLVSVLAVFAHEMQQIMYLRAIQGFMVASVSVGSRAIVVDLFEGKQFSIAITYTSIAYGLGPVLAPFIGSVLQHYFNWQANFVAYASFSAILFLMFLLFIHESMTNLKPLKLSNIIRNYKKVVQHLPFMIGIFIMAMTTVEMLFYPTVGPFVIHNLYHRSVLVYGDTALIVSAGYLVGTIVNRMLLDKYLKKQLISLGLILLMLSMLLGIVLNNLIPQYLISIMLPLSLMYFGIGFIYANILANVLSFFVDNVGPATAILTTALTAIGGIGIGLAGLLKITHTADIFYFLLIMVSVQVILFVGYFKKHITA